ncbi:MAG: hypothetical protein GWP09_02460, partial [Nitrospiraceae bacterium]|nr:hypothetical protein [Nitrospiraceae bacterium]
MSINNPSGPLEERVDSYDSTFSSHLWPLFPRRINKGIALALVLLSIYAYSGIKTLYHKINEYHNASKNYEIIIHNEDFFLNLIKNEEWENEKTILHYISVKSSSWKKSFTPINYLLNKQKGLEMFFTRPIKVKEVVAGMPKPDAVLWLNTLRGTKWIMLYFPDKDNPYNASRVMDILNIDESKGLQSLYSVGKTT